MRVTTFSASIVVALVWICAASARADFIGYSDWSQFAVLSESGSVQTNFNNGTISGNVGLGSPRQLTLSNGSITGNILFSGASNTSGLTPNPNPGSNPGPFTVSGGGTVSGGVAANNALVTAALNDISTLSQTLGGEAGTALTLTSSQTINASSGALVNNNRIFTTSSVNLNNGTILTINGSASDFVDINVTDSNPNFNGQIILTGGITSDHVLFNMFGGDYSTNTGGPSLTISTNAQTTTGTFLDPNGSISMNESVLNGRLFGGSSNHNEQIVSGAHINAPPAAAAPLPAALLAGLALIGALGITRFVRRGRTEPV